MIPLLGHDPNENFLISLFSEAVKGQQVGKENKLGTDEATASWVLAAFSLRRVRLGYGDAFSLGVPASDQDLEIWRGNSAQSDHIGINASLGNLAWGSRWVD